MPDQIGHNANQSEKSEINQTAVHAGHLEPLKLCQTEFASPQEEQNKTEFQLKILHHAAILAEMDVMEVTQDLLGNTSSTLD